MSHFLGYALLSHMSNLLVSSVSSPATKELISSFEHLTTLTAALSSYFLDNLTVASSEGVEGLPLSRD